jgi:hypothetical protein
MMRVDLEPPPHMTLEARNRCLSLPGLQLMESSSSPVKVSRGGRYLADGNDDVVLAIARSGAIVINSGGREQDLRAGEAIVLSGCEPASYHRVATGQSFTLRVPRAVFESTVVSVEDAVMRPILDRGALRLMEDYAGWLLHSGHVDQQLLNLSVRHIQDLLALAIGPTADFTETARTRGLRAARLKLAKSYVAANSHRHDLSVADLAAHLKSRRVMCSGCSRPTAPRSRKFCSSSGWRARTGSCASRRRLRPRSRPSPMTSASATSLISTAASAANTA